MTLKLNGSSSGYTAIDAPATAGSNTLVLPANNGSAGQVLQTDGNGNLTWVTLSTGKILQVQNFLKTDYQACTPDTQLVWKDTAMTKAITVSANTSKILVSFMLFGEFAGSQAYNHYIRIKRAITGGATSYIGGADSGNRVGTLMIGANGAEDGDVSSTPTQMSISDYVDDPFGGSGTVAAVTYTIQHTSHGSDTFHLNRSAATTDSDAHEDGVSWLTLKEVGA